MKAQTAHATFRDGKGVALVMVIWVVSILSVMALEFCFAMRTEVNIAKNFSDESRLYAIAEGGIQRAIAELIYKHDPRVQQMKRTLKPEEAPPERREWVTDGRPYVVPSGEKSCEIRVTNEGGKVNINTVSETTLRKIVGQLGLEGEQRDVVVDSILDWRDPDDFYHVNGAENEYYQSLKEPYQAKNRNLDAVEELLLIRGVTGALFYGRAKEKRGEEGSEVAPIGLKDIFSVYASGERIDINSAPLPVLAIVLGIPRGVAEGIVKAREEKVFQNQPDLLLRIPELTPLIGDVGRFIVYQGAVPYYTVESRGKGEGRSVRGIKALLKIDPRERQGYKMIQWVDALF
jgi:general secretion pathway protein K